MEVPRSARSARKRERSRGISASDYVDFSDEESEEDVGRRRRARKSVNYREAGDDDSFAEDGGGGGGGGSSEEDVCRPWRPARSGPSRRPEDINHEPTT